METRFVCLQGGKKFFSVRRNGEEIFVGTETECARFVEIHERKVAEDRAEQSRTPRARPSVIRTYRYVRG